MRTGLAGLERVVDVADAVRARKLSAVEVVEETLARIEALNPLLNAFVHVDPEGARRAAAALDRRLDRGEDPGPLAGVPIGVKDNEDCAGMPTAQGSLLLTGQPVAARDSIAVERLRAAGAIPVGKTATPEFAADMATHSRAFGVTRNPWNPERTPGGSSGGSAAAVASGMVTLATASDAAGSIRAPAAACGLVGLKPSYGRVPCSPVGTTNCIGAVVSCVEDAARHLDVAKGPDDRDWLSLPADPTSYERALERVELAGRRAAFSELGYPVVHEETHALAKAAAEAVAASAELSLEPSSWSLGQPGEIPVAATVRAVDLWGNIDEATWTRRRGELGDTAASQLARAREVSVPALAQAQRRRDELAAAVAALFRDYDFLLTASSLVPAFGATESIGSVTYDGDPLPFGPDPQLLLANLCGNPAISVPAGITSDGLPVGLQIIGRRHDDLAVLALAQSLARVRPWPRCPNPGPMEDWAAGAERRLERLWWLA
jgi:aspartyl-tRNA(Asn)/glutamyl-tRNA(Gln) amidotransferase subunit A